MAAAPRPHSAAGPVRVVCVCLGNICRSPMAAAILRVRADQAGLPIEVDSAGTSAWHVGDDAHPATRHELGSSGIGCAHTARQFTARDFPVADLVLAMDRANREVLLKLALSPANRGRIHLIRSFDPTAASDAEVPDPCDDGPERYREVFDMLDAACSGVLERLRSHGPPPWVPPMTDRP